MSAIPPTIGRKLWLFIDTTQPRRAVVQNVHVEDPSQPLDASIAYVWPKSETNPYQNITVSFADHRGVIGSHTVPLRQDDQPVPDAREWCEWMPFQKGQAKVQDTAPATGQLHVVSHRQELERLAVRALVERVAVDPTRAEKVAKGVKRALDELLASSTEAKP